MIPCSTKALFFNIVKRIICSLFNKIPEGLFKFKLRMATARAFRKMPIELLAKAGEKVVLVGNHRIDSVMNWSYLVGSSGSVTVIEAVPDYVENLQRNLQHHLKWPIDNISYITKGVGSLKGRKTIQIGKYADYNKIAGQSIDDGLSDTDYSSENVIDIDTVDQIFLEHKIDRVNHIHMTISGMEYEALKGMTNTLKTPGIRILIRSLHIKNDEPVYLKVITLLKKSVFYASLVRQEAGYHGGNIYAVKL